MHVHVHHVYRKNYPYDCFVVTLTISSVWNLAITIVTCFYFFLFFNSSCTMFTCPCTCISATMPINYSFMPINWLSPSEWYNFFNVYNTCDKHINTWKYICIVRTHGKIIMGMTLWIRILYFRFSISFFLPVYS